MGAVSQLATNCADGTESVPSAGTMTKIPPAMRRDGLIMIKHANLGKTAPAATTVPSLSVALGRRQKRALRLSTSA